MRCIRDQISQHDTKSFRNANNQRDSIFLHCLIFLRKLAYADVSNNITQKGPVLKSDPYVCISVINMSLTELQ